MPTLEDYLASQAGRFESELCELLRIPSVSAIRDHRGDIERAADWVLGQFQSLGFHAEKISTPGNPLIFAQSPAAPILLRLPLHRRASRILRFEPVRRAPILLAWANTVGPRDNGTPTKP